MGGTLSGFPRRAHALFSQFIRAAILKGIGKAPPLAGGETDHNHEYAGTESLVPTAKARWSTLCPRHAALTAHAVFLLNRFRNKPPRAGAGSRAWTSTARCGLSCCRPDLLRSTTSSNTPRPVSRCKRSVASAICVRPKSSNTSLGAPRQPIYRRRSLSDAGLSN